MKTRNATSPRQQLADALALPAYAHYRADIELHQQQAAQAHHLDPALPPARRARLREAERLQLAAGQAWLAVERVLHDFDAGARA
ncbi:MAG TPA: hypothetical protein VFU72_11940 [Nitrolancea sp.]|jgi:hypothetical protein|nr:hypothetical protein [Nitrolancea sp.]